tara:strand:- start:205 stop:396 length:192 start_codon:yes stop_codon:yes gene_type:complete
MVAVSALKERNMIDALSDPDLVRELIALKAKELGLEDEGVDELDALVCKLLHIEFPYPLNWPD